MHKARCGTERLAIAKRQKHNDEPLVEQRVEEVLEKRRMKKKGRKGKSIRRRRKRKGKKGKMAE